MKRLLICIALIISNLSISQVNKDSLWDIWQDKNMADTLRLKALSTLAENKSLEHADSLLIYAKYLYQFADQLDNINYKLMALRYQGRSFNAKGQYLQALELFTEQLNLATSAGVKEEVMHGHKNMGSIYSIQAEYEEAIAYYNKSEAIAKELSDTLAIATVKLVKAQSYNSMGNYDLALENIEQSIEYYKQIDDKNGLSNALNTIASSYYLKGDLESALENYKKSLQISKELNFHMATGSLLANIANIYSSQGKDQLAIKYFLQSLEVGEKQNLIYLQGAINQELFKIYEKNGNAKKALKHHLQFRAFEDSLQFVETSKKLQQMEFQKQVTKDSLVTVERERKVEEAHKAEVRKKEKNKNLALGAGLILLLLSGGLYGRWRYIKKAKAVIEKEKDRSENLLLNILPAEIAEELKEKGKADARDFEMVSILFSDFKGFTGLSEKMTAKDLVANINECFKAFDETMQKHNVEKIKTIGDAYMAAGGLPVNSKTSVKDTVLAAIEMQEFIIKLHKDKEAKGEHAFEMRVGIHTGPVVAGIVGVKKFQYDIWGDTVNTASRMESHGEIGKVNISEDTYNYIKDEPEFAFESRGKIKAKGKGVVEMYFVSLK